MEIKKLLVKLKNEKTKKFILVLVVTLFSSVFFIISIGLSSSESNQSINLKEVLTEITDKSLSWSSDSVIESCNTKDFGENFELISFSCNIYSPNLNQTRLVLWKSEELTLSNPITLNSAYKKSFENKKPILDLNTIDIDLKKFINQYLSSQKVTAKSIEFSINYDGITKFEKLNISKLTLNILSDNKSEIYINLSTKEIIK